MITSTKTFKNKFIKRFNLIKINYNYLINLLILIKNKFVDSIKNNSYDLAIILFEELKLIKNKINKFSKNKKNNFKLKIKLFNSLKKKKLKKNSFFHYYSTRIDKFKRFNKFKKKNKFNLKYKNKTRKFNMSFYRKPLKIHRYNYKFVRTMNTFFRYMKSSKYGKYLNHNKITLSRTRRRRRFLKLKFLNSVKLKKKLFKLYYFKNKIARNNFYYAILLKRKVYTKFFKGFRKRKNQKAFFKELNNFKYKLKKKI